MNPAIYLAIAFYIVPMILTFVFLFIMNRYKIDSPTTLGQALAMSCLPFLNVIVLMACLVTIIPYYLEFSTDWKRLNTWFLQGRDKK